MAEETKAPVKYLLVERRLLDHYFSLLTSIAREQIVLPTYIHRSAVDIAAKLHDLLETYDYEASGKQTDLITVQEHSGRWEASLVNKPFKAEGQSRAEAIGQLWEECAGDMLATFLQLQQREIERLAVLLAQSKEKGD